MAITLQDFPCRHWYQPISYCMRGNTTSNRVLQGTTQNRWFTSTHALQRGSSLDMHRIQHLHPLTSQCPHPWALHQPLPTLQVPLWSQNSVCSPGSHHAHHPPLLPHHPHPDKFKQFMITFMSKLVIHWELYLPNNIPFHNHDTSESLSHAVPVSQIMHRLSQ